MKIVTSALLLSLLLSTLIAYGQTNPGPLHITIVGPVEDGLKFGDLINAPNGHISFQKQPGGYRIWVPGRLKIDTQNINEEGGFLLNVTDWSMESLKDAQPIFMDLGHKADNCDQYDISFDRNYAAPNAVVPAGDSNTLLTFYDAEYHPDCPNGQPLLSSIGLATSTDNGLTWQRQGQIIEGLDEATIGFDCVVAAQLAVKDSVHLDDGASGPSIVVRSDSGDEYLYLYYADRTPIGGGPDSIYVARALLASAGMPGSWQKWNGSGWATTGEQKAGVPIIIPPPSAHSALQPHVSWNTVLHRWLMVFKAKNDFEVATSLDGLHWDDPTSLLAVDPTDQATGFPTLVSLNGGASDLGFDFAASNPGFSPDSHATASQQITGAVGWLYYSSRPADQMTYIGRRAPFRISAN